ncbi:preprotein translocase subunit YajC [Novosphingobium sp. PC22D]|uniref:preprotein translocase subunit YajC n=1 Tax=Novosphingobium sp. PC22D TaxID=1962403 RepID=UPI000BFAF722|nr:preprotein translocase subunit YajC [Novosphingobium sp. PC22D]PEQ10630.1 preprotein translocase subunit YajC [Novosphingobium sp. PC22D]
MISGTIRSGRFSPVPAALAILVLGASAAPAAAQSIGYGDVSDGGSAMSEPDGESPRASRPRGQGKTFEVTPYIEAAQVVTARLSPGDDVVTYSQLSAGVDGVISGRNTGVAMSVRYTRQFGWGKDTQDGDSISGLVNGYATVAPGLTVQAGGLATRSEIDNGGTSVPGGSQFDDTATQIYSVYAGPSFATRAGDATIAANYRIGYTRVEQSDAFVATPGGAAADVFDESVSHVADVEAGVAPGTVLPVGLGGGASYYQEDISNLDQRVRDIQVRGIVTVPVGRTLQATGAVGYEDVEISSRDALRDADGLPVVGSNGRYVTDKSAPRQIAYDVDGLIWDVGVMWRPSSRTSLTAHLGRRYGSTSVTGTFSYAPDRRSLLSVAVYDNVAGFGGQLTRSLNSLPTDFEVVRDPLSGDLRGCVDSLEGSNCLNSALGSVRSSTFRARGVSGSYTVAFGRVSAGIGAGYDRRKFIAAPGTVLAAANGVIDEAYWMSAFVSKELDMRSAISGNVYASWIDSSDALTGDVTGIGATAAYNRSLTPHLSASAAVGIDGTKRDDAIDDIWNASALLGVRYSF